MKDTHTTLGSAILFAGSIVCLVACQTNDPTPAPASVTVSAPLMVGDTSRIPDSLAWRTKSESGSRRLSCPGLSCPLEIQLKSALGDDTLTLDFWSFGIKVGSIGYVSISGSSVLKSAGVSPDSLNRDLLASFFAFRKDKDSLQNPKPSDLVAYYARLLLDSTAKYSGDKIPVGMDAAALKKAVVLLASQRGLTDRQLQTKAIAGLTTDSVRVYLGILIQAKMVADTTGLFPSKPLWVDIPLSVGDLTQGEDAAAVTGAFAWKKPRNIATTRIEVRNGSGHEDSVVKSFHIPLESAEGAWLLTNNLTLQAKMGAKVGTDTLIVTLTDDSGNTATASAVFNVLLGDTVRPTLTMTSPPSDTTVENSVSKFVLRVEASDNKGIAKVVIGAKSFTAPPYLDTVDLAVNGNLFEIQAWDVSGNAATKKVMIIRSRSATVRDTTNPVIIIAAPGSDIAVPFATDSLEISWNVSDESGIAKVTLGDKTVAGTGSAYRQTLGLSVGANEFAIQAIDSAGNRASRNLRIVRRSLPVVVLASPAGDTVVSEATDSLLVLVKVTDTGGGLKSMSVNGVPVDASGQATVALSRTGSTPIRAALIDKDGREASDSLIVERLTPPVFSIPNPTFLDGSRTVVVSLASSTTPSKILYSTDRVEWKEYALPLTFVSSQILYAKTEWKGVVSRIDSVVLLHTPSFSPPSGGFDKKLTLSITATGASALEDSTGTSKTWSPVSGSLEIESSTKVFARSRLGEFQSPTISGTYVLPPAIDAKPGTYAGKAVVHLSDPGADSIQFSTDGATWTRGSQVVLTRTADLRVRSWLDGISSLPMTASYRVAHDTTLKTLSIADAKHTLAIPLTGTSPTLDSLAPRTDSVTIFWTASDSANAAIRINGGTSNVVALDHDTARIVLVVQNGGDSLVYSFKVAAKKSDSLVDSRDGRVYRTVKIGKQWWMAQNLAYDGGGRTLGSCYSDSLCGYGRLYSWVDAMMLQDPYSIALANIQGPYKGACPTGWHVPSSEQIDTLVRSVGGSDSAGYHLKSRGQWYQEIGTDPFGFSMYPTGLSVQGGSHNFGLTADIWTTAESDATTAVTRHFSSGSTAVTTGSEAKASMFSVRCQGD